MRTLVVSLLLVVSAFIAFATPSTLVAIPSTDIQAAGTWHLGYDTYATVNPTAGAPIVDLGLTYGLHPRVEVGIDAFTGTTDPLAVNAKVLLLDSASSPVPVAVGIYNLGLKADSLFDQQIIYGVGSYTTSLGPRITAGYYTGKEAALTTTAGEHDKNGLLLGVDYMQGNWWYGVDYIGGKNAIGSTNFGVGYNFAPNVGVIFGYDSFTSSAVANTYNVQLDINF